MKSFFKVLKRGVVITAIIVPMILGMVLLDMQSSKNKIGNLQASSAIELEAFNGRTSNWIDGTGFIETGSTGANLPEPTAVDTWIDIYAGKTFAEMNTNVGGTIDGDYRLNTLNSTDSTDRGESENKPWIISSAQEFAFWAKYISLATNAANSRIAYIDAPYFRLNNDISLSGSRWVPPYFTYQTTDLVSSLPNRIYFDGNGKTISDVYVKQSYASGSQLSYPSIFGGLTPKAQVRKLNVLNAYISEGAAANPASIISQTTTSSTQRQDSIFSEISVNNSVVQGSNYNVNGIAANAAVIIDCSISNTTLQTNSSITTSAAHMRGIGQAVAFIGNEVTRCSLEVVNPGFSTWTTGIGFIIADSGYFNTSPPAAYLDYALGNSFAFEGGFFDNTVQYSKMTVTVNGGSTTNYGHASGIGYSGVVTKIAFDNNKLKNSLVSVRTENNIIATEMYATGMAYISYTATDSFGTGNRVIELTKNSVQNSTISVVTHSSTTTASGMFVLNSVSIDARIHECYTENTDVISRYTKYANTSTLYSYASGINVGYATIIEDCVVGSGNIEARNEKSSVFAYGIGSTLGKTSLSGPTGAAALANPYGRHYFEEGHEGNYDYYTGKDLVTEIKNCYNFSNITTSTIGTAYSAGIGMAEGFTNCVNYGNVVGNTVGGIALGFSASTNTSPTIITQRTTYQNAIRPLLINNCANFGNVIKAANSTTSNIGGILAYYYTSLNYDRIHGQSYDEDINGKHLEVKNCVNQGKPYFYVVGQDGSYELSNQLGAVVGGLVRYGTIFGHILLNPYTFYDLYDVTAFNKFLTERFVIKDNFYNANTCFGVGEWGYAAGIREAGETYSGGTLNEITNITGYDYVAQRPSTYMFANELGVGYNSSSVHTDYGYGEHLTHATPNRERVFNQIAKNWTNTKFTSLSTPAVSSKLIEQGWDMSSKVPQIANDSYPFQIMAYDRNFATQGHVPNVQIISELTDNQRAGIDAINFTIGELQNPKIGESVEQWLLYNDALFTPCVPNTPKSLNRVNDLPLFMLFAEPLDTQFSINFITTDAASYYDFTHPTSISIEGKENIGITYKNNTLTNVNVTAIIWSAQNKITNEWEEIFAEYMPGTGESISNNGTKTFTYRLHVTESFLASYAQGTLGNYYFNITATVSTLAVHEVNIILPAGEGNSLGVNWDAYTSNSKVNVVQESIVTLTATYDTELYEFGGFIIDGVTDCYVAVTNDINTPTMSIQVMGDIDSISFELNPRKYDINIRTFAYGSGNSKEELDNSAFIETDGTILEQAAFVGARDIKFEVSSFIEDVSTSYFYKFLGWEFIDGESGETVYIEDINILDFISTDYKIFDGKFIKRNLRTVDGESTFVIIAWYQRQVQIEINMYRDEFEEDEYSNSFEIEKVVYNSSSGSIIVNDGMQLQINLTPDTRLKISEVLNNEGKVPSNIHRIGNTLVMTAYLDNRIVNIILVPRPATLSLVTEQKHGAIYFGQRLFRFATDLDGLITKTEVELGASFEIELIRSRFGNDYRFISMGLKHASGDNYSIINLVNDRYNLVIDDSFYKNFVNIDGDCQIRLLVAATYEVDLSVTSGAAFQRRTGTYEYFDSIGNGFTLQFIGDPSSVRMINDYKFVIDYGTQIEFIDIENGEFSGFAGIFGVSEAEDSEKMMTVTSSRQFEFRFPLSQYNLNITQVGGGKATIDSYNGTFELGSIITISTTVSAMNQINSMKINGKTLEELGAVRNGNTITIEVNSDFIRAVGALTNPDVQLELEILTSISDTILFGSIGGGLALILAALLIIFLTIRSKHINEKRKKAEALAREYEKRFNISNIISDLKK